MGRVVQPMEHPARAGPTPKAAEPVVASMYESFRQFMFSANMAKTSASYAIGSATADFAKAITFSLVVPCIQMAWRGLTFRSIEGARKSLDVALVLENLLYWFCVIFVAYCLAELFFSQLLLGLKTTLDAKDTQRLHVAEDEADEAVDTIVQAAKSLVQGDPSSPYAPALQ